MKRPEHRSRRSGRFRGDELAVAAVATLYFFVVATWRVVDDDEGFYALAGRAMLDGQVPYRDFFLPQMPLAPLIFGLWQEWMPLGLVSLRGLTVAFAAATTWLVYVATRRVAGRGAGVMAVVLFATHLTVWEWAVTIKTFPVALFFPFAALTVATRDRLGSKTAWAAGLLAGLGAAGRLLVWPVLGCIWLACWWRPEPRAERLRWCARVTGGFLLALVPVVWLALLDPSSFWFDNIGYHAIRSPGPGWIKDVPQKLDIARQIFLAPFGSDRYASTGLQTTPLVLAASIAAASHKAVPRAYRAYLVMAATLAGVSFLPSPTFEQYFALTVAPLSVLAATLWKLSPRLRSAALVVTGLYVAAALPAFRERLIEPPAMRRPEAFDAVAAGLDAVTEPGRPVAAHFPAYLVASHRPALPEAQNQFARIYSSALPLDERRRHRLVTESELRAALLSGRAGAFVVGQLVVPETALALRDRGWRRARDFEGASIWVPPESGSP